jgi:DNA-binding NtrC family response regulator
MSKHVSPRAVLIADRNDDRFRTAIRNLPVNVEIRQVRSMEELEAAMSTRVAGVVIGTIGEGPTDSLAVAYQVRKQRPEARVIFVTGSGSQALVFCARRAGVAEYLTEPVHSAQIVDAIRRCLPITSTDHRLRNAPPPICPPAILARAV